MAKSRKYIFFFIIVAAVAAIILYINFNQKKTAQLINGEKLFKSCSPCHKLNTDFTGPRLKGALERWGGDKKAMYAFIRNPAKSVSENAYAKKVYEKYKVIMTAFNFTDAELDAMMYYWEKAK
jgi:cytochrome c2